MTNGTMSVKVSYCCSECSKEISSKIVDLDAVDFCARADEGDDITIHGTSSQDQEVGAEATENRYEICNACYEKALLEEEEAYDQKLLREGRERQKVLDRGPVYVLETICGGADACGGGCGGPLGVCKTSKQVFEATGSTVSRFFSVHLDSEGSLEMTEACDQGTLFVKSMFRPCNSCK